MAIDERSRHEMYLKLEQALGAEAAATLMEHLPPVGWADVATKRDLDQLRAELRNDMKDLELRLERAMRSQLNTMLGFMSVLFVTLAGLVFALAHLT